MEQRTDEWFQARCGKVTASRMADLNARTKVGWGASRKTYLGQIVAERLTGVPAASFSNAAMQWGIDNEQDAIDAYSFITGRAVESIGFVDHPSIRMSGASPDGLVGDDGLIEVKCPNTATHIDQIRSGKPPLKYRLQMLWQLACTQRAWCDYVCFDPRMPIEMQLFVYRLEANRVEIEDIEASVIEFQDEVDKVISELKKIYGEEK